MKIVPVMAIHDTLLGFKNINIVPNTAYGVRGFSNSIRSILLGDDDSDLVVSDLSLFHVGNFNLETGDLEPIDPIKLCSGLQIESEVKLELSKVELVDDPYEVM